MRVLNLIDTLGRGGAETLLMHLAEDARGLGVEVEVGVLAPPFTLAEGLEARGVKVYRRSASRLSVTAIPALAAWVRGLVHETSPDVVHAHLFHATMSVSGRVLWPRSVRTVASLHNLDYDSWRLSRAKMWLVKRLHRSALAHAVDRVVAVSDAVARHYEAQLQLSPATVIPNAVPYDALAGVAGDRARLAEVGLSPERLTVAAVGRLVHQKGHDRLLCALARLRDDGLDGQALIVGDGPERSALEALIERLQLEGYVALVPALPHPELMGLLASCDVFAMSSRFEGFGIALIEAMMLGLPPVVADISPLRELVEHGRYGRRVDASSAEALAAALGELFKTPEARRDLGERARTHAAERFSTQTVARQWHRLYQDLLET